VKLKDLGENRLVARLTRHLPASADVRVGPGDDCAVIGGPRDRRWTLLKTDAVVEGIHFKPGENMERVGWKALCRNLSDIAAMGGVPSHALITIAARADSSVASLDALYRGLARAATQFRTSIVGGETSRSPGPLFVSVALTGWVERARCILRSGGRSGDAVFVTGRLGGSLRRKHLSFIPRLVEARWLTEHLHDHYGLYGEDLGVRTARKHIGWAVHALPGGPEFRAVMNTHADCRTQMAGVIDYFDQLADHHTLWPAANEDLLRQEA